MLKLYAILFAIKNFFAPCYLEKKVSGFHAERNGYRIEKVGRLPDSIPESSGLEIAEEGKNYWTLGDGGSKSQLYKVDATGKALDILNLAQLKNIDWEALAKDDKGNIYIGEFGNNRNVRKDLRIYKVNVGDNNRVDTISFCYPDQKAFPPEKQQLNFDCEGFFWYNDSLYLFSKNRGQKCTKFYKLPDKPGNHQAVLFDELFMNAQLTDADMSPDNKLLALLSYGKIYFLNVHINPNGTFKFTPWFCKIFNRSAQAEALVFINDTDLLVSNEEGQLFVVRKKK